MLFYERAFWCNLHVFRCFQAATAIAKRGYNVDRCFIGISPGGVGQSLYSLHLDDMYKHNHAFFDPHIWHLDEELRKQVESFAKCFILTGQEAPETSKKMHIDLYKKTIFWRWHHGAQTVRIQYQDVPDDWVDKAGGESNYAIPGSSEQQLQLHVQTVICVEGKGQIRSQKVLVQVLGSREGRHL
eukprot:s2505_g7.t1